MELVRNILGITALVVFVIFGLMLYTSKREDVSWLTFIALGPAVMLSSSRYLRRDRIRKLTWLFGIWVVLFICTWIAAWSVNNL